MEKPVRKIHSLFLSAWYPNRTDAMSGLFVRKHADAVSRFCKVSVVYIHADSAIQRQELVIQHYNQVKEITVYYPVGRSIFGKLLKPFRYFYAFYKGIQTVFHTEGQPDINHVNILTRTAFPALLLKYLYKIPYVVTEHWSRYLPTRNSYHGTIRKWMTRFAVKEAALIMPVSENLQEAMLMHGLKNPNYQVIHNVVDDFFFEKTSSFIANNTIKRILHISCFDDEPKNLSGMLRAVKELSGIRNDFVLTIVGSGKDEAKIKNLYTQLNFPEGMIVFTGELAPTAIAEELIKTDFFLLFSTNENAPVVISESLACGKPVVSTNVGGIPEMLDATNSILINPRDEKALTAALDYMLDHYREFDSGTIRSEAYPKYSYEKVGKIIYELYLKALNTQK